MEHHAPSFITGAEPEAPSNSELAEISALAAKQVELEELVEHLNKQLKTVGEELRKISELALPTAMSACGLTMFKTASGQIVEIKDEVYPSIRAKMFNGAAAWLSEYGFGDVVKDEIKIKLGRGEVEHAATILDLAREIGVSADEKLFVHPQTLKALVKEQRAKGIEFPEEFFSIHDLKKSVIKTP